MAWGKSLRLAKYIAMLDKEEPLYWPRIDSKLHVGMCPVSVAVSWEVSWGPRGNNEGINEDDWHAIKKRATCVLFCIHFSIINSAGGILMTATTTSFSLRKCWETCPGRLMQIPLPWLLLTSFWGWPWSLTHAACLGIGHFPVSGTLLPYACCSQSLKMWLLKFHLKKIWPVSVDIYRSLTSPCYPLQKPSCLLEFCICILGLSDNKNNTYNNNTATVYLVLTGWQTLCWLV